MREDGSLHLFITGIVGTGGRGLTGGHVQVDQFLDTVVCAVVCLLGDQVVGVVRTGTDGLGAVVLQTHDVGGVHGGRTGVHGIQDFGWLVPVNM